MKINQLLFVAGTLFMMIGCGQNTTTNAAPSDSTKIVGGDTDEHGCKGSAGYKWSEAKQNCIRIWEEGVRLQDVKLPAGDSANLSSFVVFNADSSKVELFTPTNEKSVLISRPADCKNCKTWSNDSLEISQNGALTVKLRGKLVSQEEKAKN